MAMMWYSPYRPYENKLRIFLPEMMTAFDKLNKDFELNSNNQKLTFDSNRDWEGPTKDVFYKQVDKLKEKTETCKQYVGSLSAGINRVNELFSKITILKSDNEQYDRVNEELHAAKSRNANLKEGENPEPTAHLIREINRLKEQLFTNKDNIDRLISFLKNF